MQDSFKLIGLKEWDWIGGRELKPATSEKAIDMHNDYVITSIQIQAGKNSTKELKFTFRWKPFDDREAKNDTVISFELIFLNVEILNMQPKNFLPFAGLHEMDDFFIEENISVSDTRIRWEGLTNDETEDPKIEYIATGVIYSDQIKI